MPFGLPTYPDQQPAPQAAAPAAAGGGTGIADILRILLPTAAGVGSALNPRIARGVDVGLSSWGALDRNARLKDQLALAKQQRDTATANFGRLVDHYSGGPGALPNDRVGEFISQHNLPQPGNETMAPEDAAFTKALFEIDPPSAIARLNAFGSRERMPSIEDFRGLKLPPGAKVSGKTIQGFNVEMKGEEPDPKAESFPSNGHRIQVITDQKTGQQIARNDLGPEDQAPSFSTNVITDVQGNGALISYDHRNPKKPPLRFSLGPMKKDPASATGNQEAYKDFTRKVAMRAIGKSSGDPAVDQWFTTPQEAQHYLDVLGETDPMKLLRREILGGGAGAPPAAGPAPAGASPKPDPLGIR
jgi:hypothetical protein